MKMRLMATLSSVCLGLCASGARAAIEPFTVGASETVAHDSNIGRTDSGHTVADWYSTTEVRGGVSQALGRDQLSGSAAVNYTGYRDHADHSLDSFGYRGALRLDWSTVGDISGALGADAVRRRYTGDVDQSDGIALRSVEGRILETDSHAFAKISLGGVSRWNIFAAGDLNRRRFSPSAFAVNDEQQWSQSLGTTYSTSPDLSFGITGNYTHGEYPNFGAPADFDSRSLSATTKWQASGNSRFNAALGYTTQTSDLQPTLRFVSGNLYWVWTPPSHFNVSLGLSRSSDGGAASGAGPTATTLNDQSLNTTGSLSVTYLFTAKVNFVAGAQYVTRKYTNATVINNSGFSFGNSDVVSGADHTQRISLAAHYLATRTTDLSCSVAHAVRHGSPQIAQSLASNYIDNLVQCVAAIDFN